MTRYLKGALADILDDAEVAQLVSAFDQVGSIIVIRIPKTLYGRRHQIGHVLLIGIKTADRVFCQTSDIGGEWRTRDLELIAGSGDTITEYRENGCRFKVDVERAFFTPRLSTERARVSGMVQPGETVMNMFGGVGMYSIQVAHRVPSLVYNVDINPHAICLCIDSMRLNRLLGAVVPVATDARNISALMPSVADRTIMPLPERAAEFLEDAVRITRRGGTIHYYTHIHADKKQDAAQLSAEGLSAMISNYTILGCRLVRAVGPRYYQTVVDIRLD